MRNRLENVLSGVEVLFPEIPCSFDSDWPTFKAYKSCVTVALDELIAAAVISRVQKGKFFSSAVRACQEVQ